MICQTKISVDTRTKPIASVFRLTHVHLQGPHISGSLRRVKISTWVHHIRIAIQTSFPVSFDNLTPLLTSHESIDRALLPASCEIKKNKVIKIFYCSFTKQLMDQQLGFTWKLVKRNVVKQLRISKLTWDPSNTRPKPPFTTSPLKNRTKTI